MRPYEHDPEAPWIEHQARFTQSLVDGSRRSIELDRADGSLDGTIFDTAVNYALERIQHGWAIDERVDALRALLLEAASWAREALDVGMRWTALEAERWLQTALLAGDADLTATVAARIPQEVQRLDTQPAALRDFLVALAQLAEGHLDEAARTASAIERASTGPQASLVGARHCVGLGECIRATVAQDQDAFDAAVDLRTGAHARLYGRSKQSRRHRHGLLDLRGASVAVVARLMGLRLPAGHTYLASELIEAG